MMRLARTFVVDAVKWQYPWCAPDWLEYEKHAAPGASVAGLCGQMLMAVMSGPVEHRLDGRGHGRGSRSYVDDGAVERRAVLRLGHGREELVGVCRGAHGAEQRGSGEKLAER
jgi:hypothetical protein